MQDLSVGLAVQPCSVSSGDGSELPLQRGLQKIRGLKMGG